MFSSKISKGHCCNLWLVDFDPFLFQGSLFVHEGPVSGNYWLVCCGFTDLFILSFPRSHL